MYIFDQCSHGRSSIILRDSHLKTISFFHKQIFSVSNTSSKTILELLPQSVLVMNVLTASGAVVPGRFHGTVGCLHEHLEGGMAALVCSKWLWVLRGDGLCSLTWGTWCQGPECDGRRGSLFPGGWAGFWGSGFWEVSCNPIASM